MARSLSPMRHLRVVAPGTVGSKGLRRSDSTLGRLRRSDSTLGRLRRSDSTLGRLRRSWQQAGASRPALYTMLFGTVLLLNLVGLVMVLSASSVYALADFGSSWLFFKRQLLWTALGLASLSTASRIDYRQWRRSLGPLLLVAALLLILVLVPGVGIRVSGSTRWIGVGPLRFQPSELAKLALLLYCANLLTQRAGELDRWRQVIRPAVLVAGFFAALIMLQPDMGTVIITGIIVITVLFVGGVRLRHLTALGTVTIVGGTILAFAAPYRRARLLSYLDPWADPLAGGYQIVQSLIALGSGGWTGVGLGAGRAKWLFLPNAHTDFIFAVVGEELGLLGCLLVLSIFGTFIGLGARIALRAPDTFGCLLAAGVTGWVAGQMLVNLGAVTGVLPVTGVPLPFVSFGGSALVFTMGATGMLLNIARQSAGPRSAEPRRAEPRSSSPVA